MTELIFTKEQLEKAETLRMISEKAENAFLYDTALSGDELVKLTEIRIKLEKGLQSYGSSLVAHIIDDYRNLLIKLKFFTLYDFGEKEIAKIFRDHFLFVLKDGKIDVEKKLRLKLLQMPYKTRDPFLKEIKKALEENTEILGEKDLKTGPELREKPYLKNWLKDYEKTLGAGKHGKLEIADYLFKSQNARRLTSEERGILRKILEFYEKLKLEVIDPDALSTYSLSTFGIRSIGTGFKRRFMPMAAAVPVPPKKAKPVPPLEAFAPEREAAVRARPKVSKVSPPPTPIQPVEARPEEMVVDLREKKRAQFLKAMPIPIDVLAKLNTPQGLAQLTPKDFRSLGRDARASAEFLISKIRKLAAASPLDRVACKDNLRKSELYRIYLSFGKESLDTGRSIREVSEVRKREGRSYLTEEEYGAVGGVMKII